jgi:FtsH-binding integral membrane protein
MLMLAATTMEKLQRVPVQFWLKAALVLVGFVVGVILLRKIAGMNKAVLGAIVFVLLTVIGFNWIYERNEPAWATPAVEVLAKFFPSKGSYATRQGR